LLNTLIGDIRFAIGGLGRILGVLSGILRYRCLLVCRLGGGYSLLCSDVYRVDPLRTFLNPVVGFLDRWFESLSLESNVLARRASVQDRN
jgi:hypothetical protein